MKTSGLHINNTLYLLTERLEAKYFYLPHGPLARVELGKKSIQGLDYAYTLQGWLKDINGYSVGSYNFDIGKDGNPTNYLNKRFVNDLFSLMIQYYQTDYNPISGNNYFNLVSLNSVDLYNGNISALSLGLFDLETMLKSFRYDKLNRIKEMATAYADNNIWGTISDRFKTSYSYDFNGNITNLTRYDNGGNLLHSINYGYEDRRNRLGSINVTGSDISSSSYCYDALGNLITDTIESIHIDWNVIGKVSSVQTPNNMLRFAYNPFGQRQIKRTLNDTTYYVHDATGNVMGIYVKDYPKIIAQERPIYGSSRLGIMNKAVVFNMNGGLVSKSNSTIGIMEYELSDHLGNVSVVILDRKIFDGDKFAATSLSRTDYYPFGYPIASRSFSLDQYRYGFNGQEKDNEVYGDGKSYTAEFWQYDSRLGRRWNVDPVLKPSLSGFLTFANNPIKFRDILGADTVFDDNIARQAFRETYSIVIHQVKDLEKNIFDNKIRLIFDENLSKGQIKKINKQIKEDEDALDEWKKLEDDFNDLLKSKVLVHFNSKTDLLGPDDNGMVTGGNVYGSCEDMIGDIYVSVRPNYDDYYIHENRHVCQILQGTHIRKLLDKEREAFMYQGVFNPTRIQNIIEKSRLNEYLDPNNRYYNPNNRPLYYGLDDAIKYLYKDLIQKEIENENNK